jgi:hypothetical protein
MPAREHEPLEKIPARYYKSDLDWARQFYRQVGYNKILRLLLRRHKLAVEAYLKKKAEEEGKENHVVELENGLKLGTGPEPLGGP